ncbi:cation transporter [Ectothiorhodospiraceae bacterium WFHF3C12]|nr:cation transporter [Ectothiorhodospiraceae bacterium WFHF3C12]
MATEHDHDHKRHASSRTLITAVALTLGFAAVEAVAGYLANSLALLGDAGHMVTDSSALALGALAAWISRRPPSRRHSFGLQRAEVIGALINGVLMLAVVAWIVYEAVERLQRPQPVSSWGVIVVAAVGLAVNLVVMRVLHGGEQTLNTRGALLHVMGDLLGSVAALAAGVTIALTGWTPIDPILSLVISLLILLSTMRLLAEGVHVVMEGVPRHIDLPEVGRRLAAIEGIEEVHDLHIWTLASGSHSLSAHVRLCSLSNWPAQLAAIEQLMMREYGIEHITVQPELAPEICAVPFTEIRRVGGAAGRDVDASER